MKKYNVKFELVSNASNFTNGSVVGELTIHNHALFGCNGENAEHWAQIAAEEFVAAQNHTVNADGSDMFVAGKVLEVAEV